MLSGVQHVMRAHRKKSHTHATKGSEKPEGWPIKDTEAVSYGCSGKCKGMIVNDEAREESKFRSLKCPLVSGEEFVLHTLRKVGKH